MLTVLYLLSLTSKKTKEMDLHHFNDFANEGTTTIEGIDPVKQVLYNRKLKVMRLHHFNDFAMEQATIIKAKVDEKKVIYNNRKWIPIIIRKEGSKRTKDIIKKYMD